MKYFYRFGFGTCGEHGEITVMHENQYTKEELDTISENGYIQAYKNYEYSKEWASKLKYGEKYPELDQCITFQDLFPVFCEFLHSIGFEEIKYQEAEAEWVFGWATADVKGSWESYAGPLTQRIQEKIESTIKYTKAKE